MKEPRFVWTLEIDGRAGRSVTARMVDKMDPTNVRLGVGCNLMCAITDALGQAMSDCEHTEGDR
jgi:hypothetical protein